jgi:hypothetical protein
MVTTTISEIKISARLLLPIVVLKIDVIKLELDVFVDRGIRIIHVYSHMSSLHWNCA